MARSQVEILIESVANLHLQLSAALARESELREANELLASQLFDTKLPSTSPGYISELSGFAGLPEKEQASTKGSLY